jgi:hypothetical protein
MELRREAVSLKVMGNSLAESPLLIATVEFVNTTYGPPVWRIVEEVKTDSGTFRFTLSVLRIVVLAGRYRPSGLEDLPQ